MLLGTKLSEAFERKQNDITSYVWKGRKIEVDGKFIQEEKKLIDCTEEELHGFYQHCESMLNNTSENDPGRKALLDIIKDQRMRCNAELFLRWIESEKSIPRFKFLELINEILKQNKDIDARSLPIEAIANPCPEEFTGIPVSVIIEACIDRLGRFDKKHLTLTFILKQGVWFTAAENKELTIKDANGNVRDRMDVVRENLKLPNTIKLYATPKGLSYSQLRAMINLKSKKYSDLTTEQLTLLRDRILFSLEMDVYKHIEQWEAREEQIKKVAETKGFVL